MKSVVTAVAALFAVSAFAQAPAAPAKKEEKKEAKKEVKKEEKKAEAKK